MTGSTGTAGDIRRPRITLAWAGILAVACAAYAVGIGHESACYDEVVADAIARHRFGEIFGLLRYDNHPPLYYLLLRLVVSALGSSEPALRSISVAAAVGLVALGAGPVRRLLGDRTAFLYAGVVLFTPAVLVYAHEARMYMPAALAVTAAALYGALAVRDGRRGDWARFGVASLAAAYLHYYALFAVFFAGVFVLGWVLLRHRERLRPALLTAGLVAAAYLPWVARVVSQARNVRSGGFWIPPVSLHDVGLVLLRPFIYKEVVPGLRWWMYAALGAWLVLIAGGVGLAWGRRARLERGFGALLLVLYLGTLAAMVGLSLFFVPVLFHRYMVVCTGALALLVAMGIAQLPSRALRASVVALLAVLNAPTLRDISTRHFNYGMREVAERLRGQVQSGDLIVTTESFSLGPALYYFPQAVHYHSDNRWEERWGQILQVFIPPLHYKEGLKELLAGRRSFWNITCSIGLGRDMPDVLGGEAGWEPVGDPVTVTEPYSWCSYTARRWVQTGRDNGRSILHLQVTGLRPGGNLFVLLYHGPYGWSTPADRFEVLPVSGPELRVTLGGLDRRDYALLVWHDQNGNRKPDYDEQGVPREGMGGFDFSKVAPGTTHPPFELVRFPVREPEQSIEVRVRYPPFPR